MNPVSIFIAYSHKDLALKEELKTFLHPLKRTTPVQIWDDYDIEAGQEWESEIKERLYGADIILLLVSPDSLASDYFYGKEVKVSLERHHKNEAVVVPVILRSCTWDITPLKVLEAIPEKGKAVTGWTSRDDAFTDVAKRLGALVETVRQRKDKLQKQEGARREFEAAVKAAQQLFEHQNWTEAQKSYRHAQQLHQSGFTPDANALKAQISLCDTNIQAAQRAAQQAQKAAEAARKQQEAEAKKSQPYIAPVSDLNTSAGNKRSWLIGSSILGVLLVILFLWRPWRPADKPDTGPGKDQPALQTDDALEKDFEKARTANTLPAYLQFRQQHPGAHEQEVQKAVADFKAAKQQLLQSADLYIKYEDWNNAKIKLRKLAEISPNDPDITSRWSKYPQTK